MTTEAGTPGPQPPAAACAEHPTGSPAAPVRPTPAAAVQPTPAGARARAMLRLPAFWVVAVLLLAGAGRMGLLLYQMGVRYPVATVTAIALFALYAVPFWFFVGELDYLEREPPVLRFTAFAWGGLVATSVAIPANAAVHNLMAKLVSIDVAGIWGSAVAAPTVEEPAKVLGVLAIVLMARAQVNSVLDGLVYGALVGLGFQVVEDIVFALSAVAVAGRGDQVSPVVATFFLRGFLAGLWSHTMFSALAGAGIGYLVVRSDRGMPTRLAVALSAVLGAWACHFLWNSPLVVDGLGDGALGVLVLLLLKGTPPLLVISLLIHAAHQREAAYYVRQLADLDDPLLVAPGELRALSSGARRAHARRYAHQRAGWRARRAVRQLQQAQARLAVELSRATTPPLDGSAGCAAAIQGCRDELRAVRQRLAVLGHPEASTPVDEPGPWRRTAGAIGTAGLALAVVWAAISALGGR